MGTPMLLHLRDADPEALCKDCDPSPGWGWEYSEEEKKYSKKYTKDPGLPRAGNGYDVQGPCRTCKGSGLSPAAL
jgi:hypothetical protein